MRIELDKWQQEVLNSKGNICLRSGRQVGKSTVISILAGDFAAHNPHKRIMIIAAVERQAYLLFEKVLGYMKDNYNDLIKKGANRPTKTQLKLTNGSIIHCLPCGLTGYGIRGFTIDWLIADEAAFIPEEVWTAVTPALATRKNSRIILLSTPFGRNNYFAQSFQDKTFTKFHVSSEECPRMQKDYLEQQKARMTKRQYAQEFLGEFIDGLMQFFPDELIKKRMIAKRTGNISQSCNNFLGVDIARMGADESTFEILKLTEENRLIHIENQITTRTYLNETTKHIVELTKLYDFGKIYLDDEGIGVGVYDHLLDYDETRRIIVPINNSKRVLDRDEKHRVKLLKEDLYNNLLRLMETGEIDLLDDPEVFLSFKSVQYDYTSDTLGRSHLKIFGNYTHIVEGLIRAAWCIKEKSLKPYISY